MKKLTIEQSLGIVRHIMSIVGTLLVANSSVTEGGWELITGSALALVSILWSVFSKPTP